MSEASSEIKLPNWRDLVLRAPRMYIGHDWDSQGLHFLVNQIIRLAVAPDSMNQCTRIQASILSDGSISIEDDGRGLPVTLRDLPPAWKKSLPVVEIAVTMIVSNHPDRAYYQMYGFLDYLGVVLNAVSAKLQIETDVEGNLYALSCARGVIVESTHLIGSSSKTGTRILFQPDPQVFTTPRLDLLTVKRGLEQLAKEYPQVAFRLRDESSGTVEVIRAAA